MNRRRFIKSGLIFVPTIFSAGVHGAVHLAALELDVPLWMQRVTANGGHYTSLSVVANDTVVKMARPIYSKLLRVNTYTGGDLAACVIPLVNVGLAMGDTKDTAQNFVSGDYSESTGLTGDGSSKYMSTGFVPITHWTSDNDCSYGAYLRTNTSDAGWILGINLASGATNEPRMVISLSGTLNAASLFSTVGGSDQTVATDTNGLGHYLASRTASNSLILYRNGSNQASTTTPTGSRGSDVNVGFFVHARNNQAFPNFCSNRAFGGYHFCKGLSASEVAILYSAIQAGQRVLGRQV